jgi:hypothetical protein
LGVRNHVAFAELAEYYSGLWTFKESIGTLGAGPRVGPDGHFADVAHEATPSASDIRFARIAIAIFNIHFPIDEPIHIPVFACVHKPSSKLLVVGEATRCALSVSTSYPTECRRDWHGGICEAHDCLVAPARLTQARLAANHAGRTTATHSTTTKAIDDDVIELFGRVLALPFEQQPVGISL